MPVAVGRVPSVDSPSRDYPPTAALNPSEALTEKVSAYYHIDRRPSGVTTDGH